MVEVTDTATAQQGRWGQRPSITNFIMNNLRKSAGKKKRMLSRLAFLGPTDDNRDMNKQSLIRICKHPSFAGAMLRLIDELEQVQNKRVAIYGAGKHSEDILGLVDLQELVGTNQFAGFLSDDIANSLTFMGFPLLPTLSVMYAIDVVIISSDAFQQQMVARLHEAGYTGKVIVLYPDADDVQRGLPLSFALRSNKLHLGCGVNILQNWLNTDLVLTDSADLKLGDLIEQIFIMDATKPFPFEDQQMNFMFCEDFLEHFNQVDGLGIIAECGRILKRGGVWRISTPSFDVRLPKLDLSEKKQIDTSHWEWGHKLIYGFDYLKSVLQQAGFTQVLTCKYGKSTYPELMNIECRAKQQKSNLIIEAVKG